MNGDKTKLGSDQKTSVKAGTIVVLVDGDAKEVFGVCILKNLEGDKPYCLHHPLDIDTYFGETAKYNTYDIGITDLRILKFPQSFENVRLLVGGSDKYRGSTNMWKRSNAKNAHPFITGDDQSTVVNYCRWAESLV